jgi:hypothetical protein
MREKYETLYIQGRKINSNLLEGSQAMPVRPSEKERMQMKMLGWFSSKILRQRQGIFTLIITYILNNLGC